jgi:hypothetical protein
VAASSPDTPLDEPPPDASLPEEALPGESTPDAVVVDRSDTVVVVVDSDAADRSSFDRSIGRIATVDRVEP